MRAHRGILAASSACAILLTGTLTACGNAAPAPLDPDNGSKRAQNDEKQKTGKTDTTPTPNGTPSRPLPSMPSDAQTVSDEAVRAFVPHYIALFNYGRATQDFEPLRELSLPDCDTCNGLMNPDAGRYADGGEWQAGRIAVLPDDDPDTAEAEVPMTGAPGDWLPSPDAEPTPTPKKEWKFTFFLTWKDETWRVARISSLTS